VIVATAGHIDHGKTCLVKALTGTDTDRLPEEKARGISIDLGFAHWQLPEGGVISFVDVPGHERFIRNMVAGVCGIDCALLVVAADDGIMPQTIEHVGILDLLGITRGIAVVTKTDRVNASDVSRTVANVTALLAATTLAGAPVLAASSVTGGGMDAVRDRLLSEARHLPLHDTENRHFRLAIDRAFTIAGSGTVVTGTVFAGRVAPGDRLVVAPGGTAVRVRGVQVHGSPAHKVSAGSRCALNLSGIDAAAAGRGHWVITTALDHPTQRFDTRIRVLASERHPLRHWTPVHLHLAATHVTARIAISRGAAIAPGTSGSARIIADAPLMTVAGDRFIVRDQAASRTIGGGIVTDPFVGGTRAAQPGVSDPSDPAAALRALAATGAAVDLDRFAATFNLTPAAIDRLAAAADLATIAATSHIAVARSTRHELRTNIIAAVARFHQQQPQAGGIAIASLRRDCAPHFSAVVFGALLNELAATGQIRIAGATVCLPDHDTTANAEDERLWRLIRPRLERGGFAPPDVETLAARIRRDAGAVRDFLHRKARSGELFKVGDDRFYLRTTLAQLAALARALAQASPDHMFTAAQFRDAAAIGRTLAIRILELLDRHGLTRRVGDARRVGKDFVPVFGAAPVAPSQPQPVRDRRTVRP
jgi:selenocysteine-specific elongation factor